jgi:hypothetical protein
MLIPTIRAGIADPGFIGERVRPPGPLTDRDALSCRVSPAWTREGNDLRRKLLHHTMPFFPAPQRCLSMGITNLIGSLSHLVLPAWHLAHQLSHPHDGVNIAIMVPPPIFALIMLNPLLHGSCSSHAAWHWAHNPVGVFLLTSPSCRASDTRGI